MFDCGSFFYFTGEKDKKQAMEDKRFTWMESMLDTTISCYEAHREALERLYADLYRLHGAGAGCIHLSPSEAERLLRGMADVLERNALRLPAFEGDDGNDSSDGVGGAGGGDHPINASSNYGDAAVASYQSKSSSVARAPAAAASSHRGPSHEEEEGIDGEPSAISSNNNGGGNSPKPTPGSSSAALRRSAASSSAAPRFTTAAAAATAAPPPPSSSSSGGVAKSAKSTPPPAADLPTAQHRTPSALSSNAASNSNHNSNNHRNKSRTSSTVPATPANSKTSYTYGRGNGDDGNTSRSGRSGGGGDGGSSIHRVNNIIDDENESDHDHDDSNWDRKSSVSDNTFRNTAATSHKPSAAATPTPPAALSTAGSGRHNSSSSSNRGAAAASSSAASSVTALGSLAPSASSKGNGNSNKGMDRSATTAATSTAKGSSSAASNRSLSDQFQKYCGKSGGSGGSSSAAAAAAAAPPTPPPRARGGGEEDPTCNPYATSKTQQQQKKRSGYTSHDNSASSSVAPSSRSREGSEPQPQQLHLQDFPLRRESMSEILSNAGSPIMNNNVNNSASEYMTISNRDAVSSNKNSGVPVKSSAKSSNAGPGSGVVAPSTNKPSSNNKAAAAANAGMVASSILSTSSSAPRSSSNNHTSDHHHHHHDHHEREGGHNTGDASSGNHHDHDHDEEKEDPEMFEPPLPKSAAHHRPLRTAQNRRIVSHTNTTAVMNEAGVTVGVVPVEGGTSSRQIEALVYDRHITPRAGYRPPVVSDDPAVEVFLNREDATLQERKRREIDTIKAAPMCLTDGERKRRAAAKFGDGAPLAVTNGGGGRGSGALVATDTTDENGVVVAVQKNAKPVMTAAEEQLTLERQKLSNQLEKMEMEYCLVTGKLKETGNEPRYRQLTNRMTRVRGDLDRVEHELGVVRAIEARRAAGYSVEV